MDHLIEAKEALTRHASGSSRFVDATWFLPGSNKTGIAAHQRKHISGAVYLDIDVVAEPSPDLPHVFPSPTTFAAEVGKLGITREDQVVVYDQNSYMASARAWWMFTVFGHEKVALLNGGLRAWEAAGGAVDSGKSSCAPRTYEAHFRPELLATLDEVKAAVATGEAVVVDARSAGRFNGVDPEPRPSLPSGHIPGSLNLPFSELIAQDGHIKMGDALDNAMGKRGLADATHFISTCGSGVSAAVLLVAAYGTGRQLKLYDGSWSEYASNPNNPVAKA